MNALANQFKQLSRNVNRNSPTILTAMGVAGLVGSVVMAVKASRVADEIIEREIEFRHEEEGGWDPVIPLEDKILLTWKVYTPTALMMVTTAACIIGSNHINRRRYAALASLLAVAETGLREYQAKVVETIGEKKEEVIRGEIAKDHVEKTPPTAGQIILTGHGDFLCFDFFSKRYFRSNMDKVQRAENTFNQRLLRDGWLGINEFYYELGLEPIELGDEFGWIAERSLLEMKRSVIFADYQGVQEPCLVLDYMVSPSHI